MEFYVYNDSRDLLGTVESYEYLRWTRRYSHCGSFELLAVADDNNLALLRMGLVLWKSDDEEAGIIEHIELTMDEREYILVRGRFATGILARRIVWGTAILQGDVSVCASQLITRHLLNPVDNNRIVSGYAFSAPDLGIHINTQISYRNLLGTVESLCAATDIGIKTVWNPVSRQFTVTLYKGSNNPAVFSRDFENLTSQIYIDSELESATVALVAGEGEGAERQTVSVGGGAGTERREIFVDAKDLRGEDFGSAYSAALAQRGDAALAELAAVKSFDAAVNPHGNLKYKTDFDIGQIVKVISKKWGVKLDARITEIEESYDRDGLSLQVVFGRGLLTLAQKLRMGEM